MEILYPSLKEGSNLHFFGENSIIESPTIGSYVFDETQTDILELCDGTRSLNQIHDKIFEIYDITKEEEVDFIPVIDGFIDNSIEMQLLQNSSNQINNSGTVTGERSKYYPQNVNIELLDYCNLKCSHCFKNAENKSGKYIDLDTLKDLVKTLKGKTYKVLLTGGEPLIHPNINEVLKLLTDNFKVSLVTNGTNLHKIDTDLLEKIDYLQLSLYGHNSNDYEKITKNKNAFKDFLLGIKTLNKINQKIVFSLVLSQDNKKQLEDYVKFAIEHKVSGMRFGTPIPLGRAVEQDESSNNWQLSNEDIEFINDTLLTLGEKYKNQIALSTLNELINRDSKDWTGFFEENYSKSFSCGAGILSFTISANGTIIPCDYMGEEYFKMGNIKNLEGIFDGDSMNGFEKQCLAFNENLLKSNINPDSICDKLGHLIKNCNCENKIC